MSRRLNIHNRTYATEAFADDDGRLRLVGRLTDVKPIGLGPDDGEPLVVHDMSLTLVIELPSFEIIDVDYEMHTRPYDECTAILPDYRALLGLSIARGFTHEVRRRFGGPLGCSHLTALLTAMAPAAVQASWGLLALHEPLAALAGGPAETDDAERERRVRMNTNTCHVWHEGGEHLRAVLAGDGDARPGWMRERLVKLGVAPGESAQPDT
ncbi:MAG: DUF2889 domain-containing protein [Acidimicrobiia bacterium]|nr:DUF2889 domain-containing protein [Acidimicrobiia bacterium]